MALFNESAAERCEQVDDTPPHSRNVKEYYYWRDLVLQGMVMRDLDGVEKYWRNHPDGYKSSVSRSESGLTVHTYDGVLLEWQECLTKPQPTRVYEIIALVVEPDSHFDDVWVTCGWQDGKAIHDINRFTNISGGWEFWQSLGEYISMVEGVPDAV